MEEHQFEPTDCGLNPNFAAALSYVLLFVSGFVFLMVERQNKFVRFHAIQSLITWVTFFVALMVLQFIPVVNILLIVVGFILWLTLIFKAYGGERFKLPIVGEVAEKNA